MASQKELDRVYMKNAENFSKLSKAKRKQVVWLGVGRLK